MDEQLEFVRQIAERLRSAGLEYMMTGSMAMAIYATPRMTRDVDVVLQCTDRDVDTIVSLFDADCYIHRAAVAEAIAEEGMFNILHNEWIIKGDFIIRKDDSYRLTEFERRREIEVEGISLSVVAPEDLILSKLMWARESGSELQRRDVREILHAGVTLDRAYLRDLCQPARCRDVAPGGRAVIRSSDDVDRQVRTMMAREAPARRLRMASQMFATARALVKAGMTKSDGDERRHVFLRFYAGDFSEEQCERILQSLVTRPVRSK